MLSVHLRRNIRAIVSNSFSAQASAFFDLMFSIKETFLFFPPVLVFYFLILPSTSLPLTSRFTIRILIAGKKFFSVGFPVEALKDRPLFRFNFSDVIKAFRKLLFYKLIRNQRRL